MTLEDLQEFAVSLTPLQEECYNLLKAKQYRSCEVLAQMELSMAEQEGRDLLVPWSLLGDCAMMTKQYNKAIQYYRRISSNKYRLKEAQCLRELGTIVEASSVLETISPRERDLTVYMTLAQLYVASGQTKLAADCYLNGLYKYPMTMEAIEWLAMLGHTDKIRVLDAIDKGFKKMEQVGNTSTASMIGPIKELASALFAKGHHLSSMALQNFRALDKKFPNNVFILLQIAVLQVRSFFQQWYYGIVQCGTNLFL
jgi:tetratricopeptide (TPR) repeat protein